MGFNGHCDELADCNNHPKWVVLRTIEGWAAYRPGPSEWGDRIPFLTWGRAIDYVIRHIRSEKVAAVQDGAR